MIIEECKSYSGDCPCLHCSKLVDCNADCDTDKLCAIAKQYCEKVNDDGR
jgi:hypothetical protein